MFFIENFVTEDERNMIRSAAEPNLIESRGFERGENKKIEARNSLQAWLVSVMYGCIFVIKNKKIKK